MPCVWSGRGPLKRLLLPLLLLCLRQECFVAANSDANDTATLQNSTCNQSHCLHCDLKTEKCVKCLYVIVASSRLCLTACPEGYSTSWPSDSNLLGRVCKERSMLALISGRDVTIIAGAAVGGAVCVGVVIGALLYMKRRAKPPPCYPQPEPRQRYPIPRLWKDKRPNATEKPVANEERVEFLEQLACLRGEATNFLEMLSHTQTRFRSLGSPDSPTDTKAKAYRAVVRDLSRVLTLLNRREEHILTVPGDWRRLLSWAARVLARYKRQKTMKESGDLPTLDPLYAGGTLYQTRRQTQAQRCRLVTQGAPPPPPSGYPHASLHPQGLPTELSRHASQQPDGVSVQLHDEPDADNPGGGGGGDAGDRRQGRGTF
ncbi:uncharacterized protein LOC135094513 [Scylla paramamosain]|uniref:uncharacterized protein LOC135094513 n=1 Tax=Scylla paramamosain TaxID=85552 RepID=UPI003082FD5E